MLYATRLFNVLKNYIRRFRPGQTQRLVRTMADETRVDKAILPAALPEHVGSGPAAAGASPANGSVDGYPSGYRHPVPRRPAPPPLPENGFDIDLMGIGDLETCAENLTVPAETIERWVGAGILSPRETDIAERLLRLVRANSLKRRTARSRFDA